MTGRKPSRPQTGSGTDWTRILERLRSLEAAAQQHALSAEETRAVLKRRADLLAEAPEQGVEPGAQLDCLEFLLSGESYAIEMSFITQTLPLSDFTPLFCTPPFVLGITNLRGRIISIIDLRRFFELPSVGLSDLNRVIVVSNGSMEVGILS